MLVGGNGLLGPCAVILLLAILDIMDSQTRHCQHHKRTRWGAYVGVENVIICHRTMECKHAVIYKEDIQ